MKHKLKLAVLKVRNKRKHLPFALLLLITAIFGSAWLYTASGSSIDAKHEQVKNNFNNYNTLIGNLTVDDELNIAVKDLSYYQTSVLKIKQFPDSFSQTQPNFIEKITHKNSSDKLDSINSRVDEFYSTQSEIIDSLDYNFTTLSKFLNYSPEEDLALLGQDSTQDSERLERTKQAFQELISDTKLNTESRKAIEISLNAFDDVKEPKDIAVFSVIITDSKTSIFNTLRNQINKLKSDSSDFYNTLLYQ